MRDARIGRVLAAALHESLSVRLPFRLEFYELYLQTSRVRSASIGMAPFLAVLSFLRQEGEVYHQIVDDAGRQAAAWRFDRTPGALRWCWRCLPRWGRLRVALRLLRRLSGEATPLTRCRAKVRRWEGRLVLERSPFCELRTPVTAPMCGFYAAALAKFCEVLKVDAMVAHATCKAMGASSCEIAVRRPDAVATVTATSERGLNYGP